MTSADLQRWAGEYVLGTLAPDSRQKFTAAMSRDSSLQEIVAQWEQRLAPLDRGIAPVQPPDAVWNRIEAAMNVAPRSEINVTIRADEGTWEQLLAGVEKKQLLRDLNSGTETYLLRCAPGTVLPPHHHTMTEECLVISGDISFGGEHYGPGDYLAVAGGTDHPEAFSRGGALLYISGEIHAAPG